MTMNFKKTLPATFSVLALTIGVGLGGVSYADAVQTQTHAQIGIQTQIQGSSAAQGAAVSDETAIDARTDAGAHVGRDQDGVQTATRSDVLAEVQTRANVMAAQGLQNAIAQGSDMEKPDIQKPEIDKPEITKPEVDVPEVEKPEVEKPEVNVPEVRTPEVDTPEMSTPDVSTPEVQVPSVSTPEVQVPEVHAPEVHVPEVHVPEVHAPDVQVPDVEAH